VLACAEGGVQFIPATFLCRKPKLYVVASVVASGKLANHRRDHEADQSTTSPPTRTGGEKPSRRFLTSAILFLTTTQCVARGCRCSKGARRWQGPARLGEGSP